MANNSARHDDARFPSLPTVALWCAFAAIAALVVTRFDSVMGELSVVGDIVGPLAAGAAIAYVLNLVMERWERVWFPRSTSGVLAAVRRPVCLLLALASVVGVAAVVVLLVRQELGSAVSALWSGVLQAVEVAIDTVEASGTNDPTLLGFLSSVEGVAGDWQGTLADFLADAGGAGAVLTSVFGWGGRVLGGVVSLVIAVVFSLYLLAGKEAALAGCDRAARLVLPARAYRVASHVVDVANECFSRFIFGQCVEAVVLGCLCAVGMAIFRMPYAATVGLVVGVGALIPYVGAWLAAIVGALIIFSVDPMQAMWFVVYLVVLQQLDGHFVYPNVVGVATGVSSVWVLVAVFAGGSLFGLVGVIVSVPVVATIQRLLGEWAERREAAMAASCRADASAGAAEAITTEGDAEGVRAVAAPAEPAGATDDLLR